MGEVQVWDIVKRKLILSVPVTFDTVMARAGLLTAPNRIGCADNSVRAIMPRPRAVLFMGSHNDWFSYVFSRMAAI